MKVFMVYRMRLHHDTSVMGNHTRFPDAWFDDFVFLQEKDALERVNYLTEYHKLYCERNEISEYYEFDHMQLDLKGSWIDV
jgi:hypothetical protein